MTKLLYDITIIKAKSCEVLLSWLLQVSVLYQRFLTFALLFNLGFQIPSFIYKGLMFDVIYIFFDYVMYITI